MGKPKIYINACCFIEMACHTIGTHKPEREADILFLKQLLQGAFNGEIEAYTAILSVAECQAANAAVGSKVQGKVLTDDIKKLFRDVLTSGQYVVLVQDTVLIADRARNLRWVHDLTFSGADAVHLASALEMSCDEYLTFDDGILKNAKALESLGLTVILPRNTKSLDDAAEGRARTEIARLKQRRLFEETVEPEAAAPEDGTISGEKLIP